MSQIKNTNINKITQDINIFKVSFEKKGKVIGIDNGKKTLGLAISDYYKKIALSHKTIFKTKLLKTLKELEHIVKHNDITSLVLGLPLNKDGSKGKSAQSALAFGRILEKNFQLPILLWDERFSSIGIKREMKIAGIKKDNIEKNIDTASATWILQSALDAINNNIVDSNA